MPLEKSASKKSPTAAEIGDAIQVAQKMMMIPSLILSMPPHCIAARPPRIELIVRNVRIYPHKVRYRRLSFPLPPVVAALSRRVPSHPVAAALCRPVQILSGERSPRRLGFGAPPAETNFV